MSVGSVCLVVKSSQATRGLHILSEKPPCAKYCVQMLKQKGGEGLRAQILALSKEICY